MTFFRRRKPFNSFQRSGLLMFALASIARAVLVPGATLPRSLADSILGLLYGIAITCLLVGLRRYRGSSCASNQQTAA